MSRLILRGFNQLQQFRRKLRRKPVTHRLRQFHKFGFFGVTQQGNLNTFGLECIPGLLFKNHALLTLPNKRFTRGFLNNLLLFGRQGLPFFQIHHQNMHTVIVCGINGVLQHFGVLGVIQQ